KGSGCFAEAGFTRFMARRLDAAAEGLAADQVIAEEAQLIDAAFKGGRVPQDGARGGRDLRLHVGRDVGSALGARPLAGPSGGRPRGAGGWRAPRGGGAGGGGAPSGGEPVRGARGRGRRGARSRCSRGWSGPRASRPRVWPDRLRRSAWTSSPPRGRSSCRG